MIRENKKYSGPQTFSSLVILLILIVTGTGIFLAQFNFNPSVLPKDLSFSPGVNDKDHPLTTSMKPIIPLPPGIVPLTPPESFNPQNLSDKINGKAELYLSAGFIRLDSQRFKSSKGADLWIEAYIYDMENGQNAFSVFSAQRREGAAALDLTQYAYRTSNALFLVHGRFYIEIIASESMDHVFNPMKLLAENFIRNTVTQNVKIEEKDLFPVQGLVTDSISLISADAFGFERLNQIYTAEYELGQQRLMAFLSRRQDIRAAQELASAYHKFIESFGGQNLEANMPIRDAQLVEILETYEVIFSCGPFMAGVREAASKEQAINLARQLYEKLKEVTNASEPG